MSDLIERLRKIAKNHRYYGPYDHETCDEELDEAADEIERLITDCNRWKREAEHVAGTCHAEIDRLRSAGDTAWKLIHKLYEYEAEIERLQGLIEKALAALKEAR